MFSAKKKIYHFMNMTAWLMWKCSVTALPGTYSDPDKVNAVLMHIEGAFLSLRSIWCIHSGSVSTVLQDTCRSFNIWPVDICSPSHHRERHNTTVNLCQLSNNGPV